MTAHLTAFDVLLPPLFAAYDALPGDDPRRAGLKEAIEALRGWEQAHLAWIRSDGGCDFLGPGVD